MYLNFIKIPLLVLAIVVISLFVFTSFALPVRAEVLKNVTSVYIQDASIIKSLKVRNFNITFTTVNDNTFTVKDVSQGIQMQNKDGNIVYTQAYDTKLQISSKTSAKSILEFSPPNGIDNGIYKIFVVLNNKSGNLISVSYVGEINLENFVKQSNSIGPSLNSCIIDTNFVVKCSLSNNNSDSIIEYTIRSGSPLGDVVIKDDNVAKKDSSDIRVDLKPLKLKSGIYNISFVINSSNKSITPFSQKNLQFVINGTWMTIVRFNKTDSKNGVFKGDLYLNGVGEKSGRGFRYWVLDDIENICVTGDMNLEQQIPRKRSINTTIPENCAGARLVGFIYSEKNKDGTYNIEDSIGDVSFKKLIKRENLLINKIYTSVKNFIGQYPYKTGFIILILSLILFVGVSIKNIWKKLHILFIAILILAFTGGIQVVSAESSMPSQTFISADKDTITFIISDIKQEYQIGENITFTVAMSEKGVKPKNSSMQVSVNNGLFTPIIRNTDTNTIYTVSLLPISTAGKSTLIFKAPNLCGGAFNFSTFNISKFSSDDCTFSVDINLIDNTPPDFPVLRGECIVGVNNTYKFNSLDEPNDKIYYDVDFNNNNIIDNTSPILNQPMWWKVNYNGWVTKGVKYLRARATDSYGDSSGWKTYSVMCDNREQEITFYAQPSLVLENATTTLNWNLKNVLECSIKGTNGDSWGWDIVGSKKQKSSGKIIEKTTYTLSCIDLNNKKTSTTTDVNIVPQWQEI